VKEENLTKYTKEMELTEITALWLSTESENGNENEIFTECRSTWILKRKQNWKANVKKPYQQR
jgi:hypothetical protein